MRDRRRAGRRIIMRTSVRRARVRRKPSCALAWISSSAKIASPACGRVASSAELAV
jgi:hypothetical protein